MLDLFIDSSLLESIYNQKDKIIIINGDSLEVMKNMKEEVIDLVITSPPYSDQRKQDYGGVSTKKYIDYFMPFALEIKKKIKNSGNFLINIKEKTSGIERDTYVIELILEMRRHGWLWVEEYIWHKKNPYPGRRKYRLKDAFERILHFAKSENIILYFDNVREPLKLSTIKRAKTVKENEPIYISQTKSGFSFNRNKLKDMQTALPSNVLYLAAETKNVGHSAAFPVGLPDFFIRLFTKENDIVLDPFSGSGTTGIAALKNNRRVILIEKEERYYKLSIERIRDKFYYTLNNSIF